MAVSVVIAAIVGAVGDRWLAALSSLAESPIRILHGDHPFGLVWLPVASLTEYAP